VLGSLSFHLSLGIATQVLMYLVAATTLLSVAAYLTGWMRHMNAATAKQ
jgi:hypothetical protein